MSNGMPEKKKGLSPLAWVAIGCVGLLVVGGIAVTVGTMFLAKKGKEFVEGMEENPARTLGKAVAFANPELEFVDADEGDETVTFRNTKTGEEITIDASKIREGNFSITGPDGKIEFNADGDSGGVTVTDKDGTTKLRGSADEGGLTLTDDTGDQVARFGGSVRPGDLPAALSLYPGATVSSSYSSEQGGKKAGAVTLATDDSLDDVLKFYEKVFDNGDYAIQSRTRSSQGDAEVGILSGTNPDGETLNLMATWQDGKTQAVVSYGQK